MKQILVALLFCSLAFADTTVTVKAVEMEVGHAGEASYNYHSMIVDVDGTTYKISRPFVRHETWLHKGTYTGRWKDGKHRKLQIDMPEEGKFKHVDSDVLAEE